MFSGSKSQQMCDLESTLTPTAQKLQPFSTGAPGVTCRSFRLVVLIVGSSKESVHWCGCIAAAAVLPVTLRPLVVGSLLFFLFSLTLGVGVLILCDRRLRMKSKGSINHRTQHPYGSA